MGFASCTDVHRRHHIFCVAPQGTGTGDVGGSGGRGYTVVGFGATGASAIADRKSVNFERITSCVAQCNARRADIAQGSTGTKADSTRACTTGTSLAIAACVAGGAQRWSCGSECSTIIYHFNWKRREHCTCLGNRATAYPECTLNFVIRCSATYVPARATATTALAMPGSEQAQ